MLSADELVAIKRRLLAATPIRPPFNMVHGHGTYRIAQTREHDETHGGKFTVSLDNMETKTASYWRGDAEALAEADAEFIANCYQDVPRLLADVVALYETALCLVAMLQRVQLDILESEVDVAKTYHHIRQLLAFVHADEGELSEPSSLIEPT